MINGNVGGLVGNNTSGAAIYNSYSVVKITSYNPYGGLIGYDYKGYISNSYWSPETGGGSIEGGTKKTLKELLEQSTYESWDFDEIWSIEPDGGSTPYLKELVMPEEILIKSTYKVEYYKQNKETGNYDLAETDTKIGAKNRVVTAVAKPYEGYKFNAEHPDRIISGIVLEDGSLVLKLYYDINTYNVRILNLEAGNKIPIQNIVVGLFDKDGNAIINNEGKQITIKTEKNGEVIFTNLKAGTYKYKQLSVPTGYILNDTMYTITISENGDVIFKEEENGIIYNQKNIIMQEKYNFIVTKYKTGTEITLSGAVIGIFNSEGKEISRKITDENGIITITGLEVGNYYYKEIQAPVGYVLNNTKYYFTVEDDGTVSFAEGTNKVIYNDRVTMLEGTGLTIKKYRTNTAIGLPGATIAVFDEEGNKVVEKVTGENGTVTFTGLEYGSYYYKEIIAPTGYIANSTQYHFIVNNEGRVVLDEGVDGIIYNDRKIITEKLEIAIVWNDNNNITGVRPNEIELTLVANGVETQRKIIVSEKNNWSVTLTDLEKYDENGNEIIYTVIEKEVPEHYIKIENGLTITNTIDYERMMTNIILKKYEEGTTIGLKGSVIKINNELGDSIKVTTDENGEVLFRVVPGKYQYKEIVAPNGYILNNKTYTFTVKKDGTVIFEDDTNGIIYGKKENQPDIPNNPDLPDKPDIPNNPDVPDQPDKPNNPNIPDNSDTPDKPNQPNNPNNPDNPSNPNKPNNSDKIDKPNVSDKDEKLPEKDTTKTDGKLPQTGETLNFVIIIISLIIICIYNFIKIKNIKEIK